ALKMFHIALSQKASMPEIISEAKKHLKFYRATDDFIKEQVKRIKCFSPNPLKNKIKMSKAWLVTWEGTDVESKYLSDNIVSVFSSRTSSEKIKNFIENYYISNNYSLLEKLTYAKNRKNNPYQAEYCRINGVQWLGRMTCGHNPFLYARVVQNLTVGLGDGSDESVVWEEIEVPKNPLLSKKE
ncbi:hypothetical protein KAR91_05925, partial [Candidatus Pacearchaeota archaeon]|nr:hypothetical protein [Candidatus Pacearchaeota archaeon]